MGRLRAWFCFSSVSRAAVTVGLLMSLGLGPAAAAPAPLAGRGGQRDDAAEAGSLAGWRNGLIAYTETRVRLPPRVAVVRPDGTGKRALALGHDPAFSPDGRKLLFVRGRGVYVMDVRTRRTSRVGGASGAAPSWAPDGKRIVVGGRLAVTEIGGRSRTVFRRTTKTPSWSPDGKRIAFVSEDTRRGGSEQRCGWSHPFQVYTIGPSGKGLRQLTSDGNNLSPAWSPDGKRIAYFNVRSFVGIWLMTMNADGSGKRAVQLIGQGVYPWVCWRAARLGLAWSPDGRQFVLVAGRRIATLDVDGSGMRSIATGRGKVDWQRVSSRATARS